jgi:ribbon-helix-helix CopG family protein
MLDRNIQCIYNTYIRWYDTTRGREAMTKSNDERTVVKTSINLPQEEFEALRQLAQRRGSTMADVVRRAISTEKFLDQTRAEGGKVLIEGKDKQIRELLIRG